jgi:hypothetical protein
MTTSGMLAGLIALVLALVGGAVATDAFERTAGNSWADAGASGETLGVARPLSWSSWAQAPQRPISLSPTPSPSPLLMPPISLSLTPSPSPLLMPPISLSPSSTPSALPLPRGSGR